MSVYVHNKIAPKPQRFWVVCTVILAVLSCFLAYVAVRNSSPVNCDSVSFSETGQQECILDLEQPKITSNNELTVTMSEQMQPFGTGYEDEDTAQLEVLPTSSPSVTAHSLFVQGSQPENTTNQEVDDMPKQFRAPEGTSAGAVKSSKVQQQTANQVSSDTETTPETPRQVAPPRQTVNTTVTPIEFNETPDAN